jgi:cobaltochelatase CobS
VSDASAIKCKICGEETHAIELHLRDKHPELSIGDYRAKFPQAPIYSESAKARLRAAGRPVDGDPVTQQHAQLAPVAVSGAAKVRIIKKPITEVFGLPDTPELRTVRNEPIQITTLEVPAEFQAYIPDVDTGHVWNVEDLKNMLMALEMDMPLYVWGHKGCGKTTDLEQICARTGRPLMRVQHTINTEESHILGQYTIQNGETVFELGPLPIAMKHGFIFLADEYDFALASVLSVYQPVLEGKSLLIKEAPAADRIIRPNKTNFRFFATGNTNGSGDETGLYQGTSVQNAANFDRFGMVIQKDYMDPEAEAQIIVNRSGITPKEAKRLVEFAKMVRTEFANRKINDTVSTRALVNIARIGLRRKPGGAVPPMRAAVSLCFANKLNAVDRATVDGVAQRIYG